jgi:AraC family transcriptional regulator, arabinose operon regulatory protein
MRMREDIISFYNEQLEEGPFCIEMTGISYCDGTYKIERKNSYLYCFEYILKGQGTVIINGETFTPVEGDIYILQKKSTHIYFSDNENPWEKIWFNIKGPLVDNLMQAYKLNSLHHVLKLDLKELFFKFLSTAQSKTLSKKEIFKSNAIVFHEILSQIYAHTQLSKVKYNPLANKLREYLDKNIMNQISLKELSFLIQKSPSQTIRIFKKEFGLTPYEYLLNNKIETAKLLLLNTNLQVNEIAYSLKFADEHYFSNYFKATTGVSPRKFRFMTT